MEKEYKILLTITAVFEGATGLALIVSPDSVISILLNAALSEPGGIVACRVAGAALLTLTIICWLYRSADRGAVGVTWGILFYNVAASSLLVNASSEGYAGIALWPAVLLHLALAVWCCKLTFTFKS